MYVCLKNSWGRDSNDGGSFGKPIIMVGKELGSATSIRYCQKKQVITAGKWHKEKLTPT